MTVSQIAVDPVTGPVAEHGEGPVWDPSTGHVRWVDMLKGDLLELAPATGTVTRQHVGTVAAALRPRTGGGWVLALERGFALLDEQLTVLPELWSDPTIRMNDGGCDPQGRFYCGTMAYDAAPGRGSLHRLDTDGTAHAVLTGVTISNGIVWTLDGNEVLYIDTPTGKVVAYRFDAATGTFGDRRTVITIPRQAGLPDGMALDSEGGIWVALWEGGAVHRYLHDGTLAAVVSLPVSLVTACCFGGPGSDELYITSSRQGLHDDDEPLAGALFRARVGVTGAPVHAFAG